MFCSSACLFVAICQCNDASDQKNYFHCLKITKHQETHIFLEWGQTFDQHCMLQQQTALRQWPTPQQQLQPPFEMRGTVLLTANEAAGG